MSRFKIVGGVALLLFTSLCSANALAGGRGVLRCDSCATVSDFSGYAKSWVLSNTNPTPNPETYRFAIFNPTDGLLGQMDVVQWYDAEFHKTYDQVVKLTGTVGDMQQAYLMAIPSEGLVDIPSSVATTYTGLSQEQVVGPWLASYFANSNPAQDSTTLAVFPDYSSAVYQLIDSATSDWAMVSGSGHDSNGDPMTDDDQPVTTAPAPGTVIITIPITVHGYRVKMNNGGGGYGVYIFGISDWVNGVIYCMINGCTRVD